jgi:hypothetical protein
MPKVIFGLTPWHPKIAVFGSPKVKLATLWAQDGHRLGTDAKIGQQKTANPLKLLARDAGFEPATSASGGQRSIQLS